MSAIEPIPSDFVLDKEENEVFFYPYKHANRISMRLISNFRRLTVPEVLRHLRANKEDLFLPDEESAKS